MQKDGEMARKVKGYLASDGQFFETEPECLRHEAAQEITKLCESHGVNADNFFALLREWNESIRNYYHADARCITKAAIATGAVSFELDTVPPAEDDYEDPASRDKDSAGFLEFAARKHK